jgi:hypothetical protein
MKRTLWALCLLATSPSALAGLMLNEMNAVGSTRWLGANTPGGSTAADATFGRVQGNGGNWIELVVTTDHLDVRDWELRWYENDAAANGSAVWDPTRTVVGQDAQGVIKFSSDAFWSDLRQGTILTITENASLSTINAASAPVVLNLATDLSFNPLADDWHINVSTLEEAGKANGLLTTVSNLTTYVPGSFSAGNDNWELRVVDGLGNLQTPVVGEAYAGVGVSSTEIFKAEGPSSPASLADWLAINAFSYNDGTSSTFGKPNAWSGGTITQDFSALRTAEVPEASSLVLAGLAGALVVGARELRHRKNKA